jgi:hypothetical protein
MQSKKSEEGGNRNINLSFPTDDEVKRPTTMMTETPSVNANATKSQSEP